MASNWSSNFAAIQHTYIPTSGENTNIDDLFKKKEEDINVIKMIEVKDEIVDLIHKKEEIEFTEEEKKIIQEGNDEDTDNFIGKIKEYIQEFIQLQGELNQLNDNFKGEIKILQDNISTLDNMIRFIEKLPEEHKDETIMKTIIESMNELSNKIMKNDKLKETRKEYIQKRKEIEKYIYFIQKLNNFNQCNICPVCFTNTVDHFVDPCGHTFCKDCIKTLRKNPEVDLYEIGRNDNSQCCFCRERIKTIRQLYFL
tara:strand:- start:171 stop:935 length:765 start_codon:yes stop_codon:yes gene_type:complete